MFPTNILLATDGSDNSLPALRAAAELSARTDSGIQIVYVGKDISTPAAYNDPSAKDMESVKKARALIEEQIRRIEADGGTVAGSHIVPGKDPAKEIVNFTRDDEIGLAVVGSGGSGRLSYALGGSVSAAVIQDAYCPVFVVHGQEA